MKTRARSSILNGHLLIATFSSEIFNLKLFLLRMLILGLFVAAAASARNPDGTLGLIQTPNNGVPAMVLPGGAFECVLPAQASLQIAGVEAAYPLETTWSTLPGERWRGVCIVPANTPPGTYALEATAGDITDRTVRAVFVRKEFPDYYVVAHLSDIHIGKKERSRPPEDVARELFEAVSRSDASFVLVTGDLTEDGEMEQFRLFLEILDACTLPTFVVAGNHDRLGRNYELFFGPTTYMFRFGRDGYLAFDTKDFMMADDLGPQDGQLEVFRRALLEAAGAGPSRWSFGVTHRYEPMMGMRSQLILFIDTPLDWLFFGHWHRENTPEEKTTPWGATRLSAVPAAMDGYLRFIDIADGGILLRSIQSAGDLR